MIGSRWHRRLPNPTPRRMAPVRRPVLFHVFTPESFFFSHISPLPQPVSRARNSRAPASWSHDSWSAELAEAWWLEHIPEWDNLEHRETMPTIDAIRSSRVPPRPEAPPGSPSAWPDGPSW